MSKFSDYLASQITPQMTLLEKFNLMIKFLQENNYISVFYSQENYNLQTESYQKEKVNLNGFTLHIGDCIVFSNGYYGFVETIGVNNFTIGNILYFQGEQGVSVVGATILSGNLILTLSDGENVNAGNIGAVSSFSINSSQHLIVNYADGTTQDLGEIFNGNVSITGNFTVSGDMTINNNGRVQKDLTVIRDLGVNRNEHIYGNSQIDGNANIGGNVSITGDVTADEINAYELLENNSNQSFSIYVYPATATHIITGVFGGMVKTGNKLTCVFAFNLTVLDADNISGNVTVCQFRFTNSIGNKLYPTSIGGYNLLGRNKTIATNDLDIAPLEISYYMSKQGQSAIPVTLQQLRTAGVETGKTYYIRIEETFLLSDNLL